MAWMFRDGVDEFGLVRDFDGIGDWDLSTISPPDGEMISLETSLAQSGHQHAPAVPKSSVAEPDPEPEESQVRFNPMDLDLGVIPEEGPEEEADPVDEPVDELDEEHDDEERIAAPVESGEDENNPIEIEADSKSSEELETEDDSDKNDEESQSE